MLEILERIAEEGGSINTSGERGYSEVRNYLGESIPKSEGYSTFAEMYLEKPVDMGITASVSTWRGIPTIDDW